jgi:hypothetical protein
MRQMTLRASAIESPEGKALKERQEQARIVSEEQQKAEEEAARQKLMLATVPGTSYIGISSDGDKLRRIRLVFTEHNNSLIRAEASNPDNPQQKQTFTGELVLKPQPEGNNPGGTCPIVMSSLGRDHEYGTDYFKHFYESEEVSLRLRLADTGLEGSAEMWMIGRAVLTIRLQREGTSSVKQRKAEEEAIHQKLMLATVPGTSYIGTITCEEQIQRLRLVFTEQEGFLIRAEASNPDRSSRTRSQVRQKGPGPISSRAEVPQEKQTFAGELNFNPKTEGDSSVAYPIVMSPVASSSYWMPDRFECFYKDGSVSLKLRLTDTGMEGETQGGLRSFTIHLQRQGTPSATSLSHAASKAESDPNRPIARPGPAAPSPSRGK